MTQFWHYSSSTLQTTSSFPTFDCSFSGFWQTLNKLPQASRYTSVLCYLLIPPWNLNDFAGVRQESTNYGPWAKSSWSLYKWLKKTKRIIFHDMWNYIRLKFQCLIIKLWWNTTTPMHSSIVYAVLRLHKTAELSSCVKGYMPCKAEHIYSLDL